MKPHTSTKAGERTQHEIAVRVARMMNDGIPFGTAILNAVRADENFSGSYSLIEREALELMPILKEPTSVVHCRDCCCARSWEALGIDSYTGKAIPEHITELRAQRDVLMEAGKDLAIWLTGESHPEFQALAESEYDNAINQEQNPDCEHIKARMVARLLAAIAKAEGRAQ